jgi:hypothetical protein
MKIRLGDASLQEAIRRKPLMQSEQGTTATVHALAPIDHLIERVGIGMVQAVETYYEKYRKKPNEANARAYNTWRFRLHQRLKNDREILDEINKARNLGLYDENPGKTFWDCEF